MREDDELAATTRFKKGTTVPRTTHKIPEIPYLYYKATIPCRKEIARTIGGFVDNGW